MTVWVYVAHIRMDVCSIYAEREWGVRFSRDDSSNHNDPLIVSQSKNQFRRSFICLLWLFVNPLFSLRILIKIRSFATSCLYFPSINIVSTKCRNASNIFTKSWMLEWNMRILNEHHLNLPSASFSLTNVLDIFKVGNFLHLCTHTHTTHILH